MPQPGQIWEVVGGGDKGGIIVREGKDLKSAQADDRLSTGALIREQASEGERMRYLLLKGSGPQTGWVSTKLKDKDLVVRTDKKPPGECEPVPAPAVSPVVDAGLFDFDDISDQAPGQAPAEVDVGPLWEPLPEQRWRAHPRAGPGLRPKNMVEFKKVVNVDEPGEFWGIAFPKCPAELRSAGPRWLTRAMRTAGTLPEDNEVVRFKSFDVKAEDPTMVGDPDNNNWGGACLKVLISVEYKVGGTGLAEDMFIKMPHEYTGKNERFKNSVTATGDWSEVMFYNFLGGKLPVRTPKCYFADMSRKTTNFIIVIERIPFSVEPRNPGDILPAAGKYRDWAIPNAADLYYAHARALAQFFAWHKAASAQSTQVDECFMEEGTLALFKSLHAKVRPMSMQERDAGFTRLIADPAYAGFMGSMGFPAEINEGFVGMAEEFILKIAPHIFPKDLVSKKFSDKFFKEAREMGMYVKEMAFYTAMTPEYFTLAHPNAQIDNAFFMLDDSGDIRCGLLDWGFCMHQQMPSILAGGWMGAEPDLMDEHEEKLTRFFLDEYRSLTGVELDFEDFYMNLKLTQASAIFGCSANIGMLLRIVKKDEWKTIKDRFDPKIDDGFLRRCYMVQIEMLLAMARKRSCYPHFQRWMSKARMPKR